MAAVNGVQEVAGPSTSAGHSEVAEEGATFFAPAPYDLILR
jgi:hypothetical protein